MEDRMVELLKHAQKKFKIKPEVLCAGICTEEMYHMVIKGNRFFDRITVKRLIARVGLDNALYDNYLHYSDYCVWVKRTRIINAILESKTNEAEKLLTMYFTPEKNNSDSRINIEKQFEVFMSLQVLKIKSEEEYEKVAATKYKEALNYTVSIEDAKKAKLLLSPVELCMYIEYLRRTNNFGIDEIWNMYVDLISYIDNSYYGKLAKVKVYPKLIVCLYNDIKRYIVVDKLDNWKGKLKQLLEWCEIALELLREQVSLLYMTEILEIRLDIFIRLNEFGEEDGRILETQNYLDVLKGLYDEYSVCPYMTNDAYLYRESGNFCIGEVIYKRRTMKKITRKELSAGICDERTIRREESHKSTMQKYYFEKVFDKLKINPNYIDTGIVVEKMEQLELYHCLHLADNAFDYDKVQKLLEELKKELPEHPINKQVIKRIDSFIKYRKGIIGVEEHLRNLKEALSYTIDVEILDGNVGEIFLTLEEMLIVYMMSEAHRDKENYIEAYKSIEILWDWCKQLEKEKLESGRMGIYDFIMLYMSNLLGDMKRYDESNHISTKLVKMGLVYRYSRSLHRYLYDRAWNNNQRKLEGFDYNKAIQRCIHLSQLNGDVNDEIFYKENLTNNDAT